MGLLREGTEAERCRSKCAVTEEDGSKSAAVGRTGQKDQKEKEVVTRVVRTGCRWLLMEYRLLMEVLAA